MDYGKLIMWNRAQTFALLGVATLLRLSVAAAVRFLPYKVWQPLLLAAMSDGRPAAQGDPELVERVLSAVAKTEELLPAGRCLERALTAWLLLRRQIACKVQFGASLDKAGKPFAHAWLEADGVILLGGYSNKLSALHTSSPQEPAVPKGQGRS
jgi:hypothetical protein